MEMLWRSVFRNSSARPLRSRVQHGPHEAELFACNRATNANLFKSLVSTLIITDCKCYGFHQSGHVEDLNIGKVVKAEEH